MRLPSWSLRPQAVAGVLIVGAVAVAYLPALGAGFVWDDDDYVSRNPVLTEPDGLRRIWFEPTALPQYYPLVHTSFWIERRLFGLAPAGYHAVNVLLHALAALLLLDVLRRLGLWAAPLAAALFALHPVQVETVAWITERKNLLSMVFALLALRAWVMARRPGSETPGRVSTPRWCAIAALFALGLAGKTVVGALPAVLLVIVWWKEGRLRRSDVLPALPLFALGLAAALGTAWLERVHVRAEGAEWDLGPAERILVAGRALWFYAGKLAWPADLAFNYRRWTLDAADPQAWAFPITALLLVATAVAGRRLWGRGPAAALLLFGGILVPALGFVDVYPMRYAFVADHFQYHATAPLLALFAAMMAGGAARLALPPRAARAAATLLLAALAALSFREAREYQDLETLWRATIATNPDSWLARTNLGKILIDRGEVLAGIEELRRALLLHDGNADGHNNLAAALYETGDRDGARRHLERAILVKPDHAEAHANLAIVLLDADEAALARRHLERSLALAAGNPDANFRLGSLHAAEGRHAAALELLLRATALAPGRAEYRLALARTLAALGRHEEALGHLAGFLEGDPALRLAAAASLDVLGRHPQAIDQLAAYVALRPGDTEAWSRLVERAASFCRQDGGASALKAAALVKDRGPELLQAIASRLAAAGDLDLSRRLAEAAAHR